MFQQFGPPRAADGIKARAAHKGFASQWWAKRWLELLESFGWASRLTRGRNYARKGQVLAYEVEAGIVRAHVQGSQLRPYAVTIELAVLSPKTWQAALRQMGERAVFAASLLAGEMPSNIEEAFPDRHPLLPQTAREFKMRCSCPDSAVPCKHLAAVFYLLAELFDEDPFLIFQLRGQTREQVLAGLPQLSAAEAPEEPEEITPALDAERFWREPPPCPSFPAPSPVECSLLRRLGPPGAWTDEEELLKAFLPLYRTLSR